MTASKTSDLTPRTWILHPAIKRGGPLRREPQASLEECVGLAAALDLVVVGSEVVSIAAPRAGYLFGEGRIKQLGQVFAAEDIALVIVDGPVTPVQQRNLERAWKVKVLDRTGLILEIFGERASTREGVLQVDLAHLEYQKSRLVRSWTHLERQRGGAGFMGGPGETQIEADRRALDERILRLKRHLTKVVQTRSLHRKARQKVPYPVVALVGYTNAGKSTLFNRIADAGVLARDMLFATLDPTMRAIRLPSGRRVILSDTVGFISDLPTQLVAAFRATLEEVLEADLIIHVRDIAHPETEAQCADVLDVLGDLGVARERLEGMIEARNKADLVEPDMRRALESGAARADRAYLLSAVTGEGVETLLAAIDAGLSEARQPVTLRLDHGEGRGAAWLHELGTVVARHDSDTATDFEVMLSPRELNQFVKAFPEAVVLGAGREMLARAAQ